MNTNTKSMTLGEVCELPDDSWVNGEFKGVVNNVEDKTTKTGAPYSTGFADDPDTPSISIKVTVFGRSLKAFAGKVCLFGGQGIKKKSFRGSPELSLGEKATINVIGSHTGTPKAQGGASEAAGKAPNGANHAKGAPEGQTLGMALKAAVDILLHNARVNNEAIDEDSFTDPLYRIASRIMRTNRYMAAGNLAENPKTRPAGAPKAPQPVGEPEEIKF